MAIINSYLTQPAYNYDTTVAVTQRAINDIIKKYYQNVKASKTPFTEQVYYFINVPEVGPAKVDKATLLQLTNNIDPLTVTSSQTSEIEALRETSFAFAFAFTPGDPTGLPSDSYTYVNLLPQMQMAEYYLLCTSIQIALWSPDSDAWVNVTQSKANEFNICALVNFDNIIDDSNLPPAVQAAINDLGPTDVNVQQLIFDLDRAACNATTSTIPGITPGSPTSFGLLQQFVTAYFNAYQSVWIPVLNYAITQKNPSTLIPTSMDLYVGALVDSNGKPITTITDDAQADLFTINYLFAVNGNQLPQPAQFNWNWLENNGSSASPLTPGTDPNADVNKYSGAISIKRDALANYFHQQLLDYVNSNCWVPEVTVNSFPITPEYTVSISNGTYDIGGVNALNPDALQNGYADILVQYLSNKSAIAYGWADNNADHLKVDAYFNLQLEVESTGLPFQTLTLTQTLYIEVDATGNKNIGGYTPYTGRPISKIFVDTFNVIVDTQGNLDIVNVKSTLQDNPDPNAPQYVQDALKEYVGWQTAENFAKAPIAMPKQFVFPGGNAFIFNGAQFSYYSDLVCHINYISEA